MASRWVGMLERFGHKQRLALLVNKCGSDNAAANPRPARQFSSDFLSPTRTTQNGAVSTRVAAQGRDVGLYHLTQLFGKFVKSGEDRKAARLMEGMTSLDSPVTVIVCNYLLNSCAKIRNAEMAKEVWSFMKLNAVQMNEKSYGCMLCALSKGGCLEEAVDLLHLLFKRKQANVVMYNTVLNACVHAKSKTYGARCVQLMEAQGVSKDELSYIELLKLSGMRGDLDATNKWWKELISNFAPSPSTRSPYIIALCRMNALTEAREALQEMVSDLGLKIGTQSVYPKEEVFGLASNAVPSELKGQRVGVDSLGKIGEETAGASSKLDNSPQFVSGVSKFQLSENQENSPLYGGGQDNMQYLPDQAVAQLSTELSSLGPRLPKNTSTSLKNLQNAYNSMINAAGKAGDHILAESLFSEMRHLGLKTDIYTYNALLRAVVEGRGVHHALRIVKRMEASGLQPDVQSLTALLEGYCQKQQLNKAEDILKYMEQGSHSQKPSCYAYNIMLKACATVGDPLRALQVFVRMKEVGVAPDSCTYVALLSACGNTKTGMDGSSKWLRQEVVKRVTAIEMDMAQSGIQHTHETLTSVMCVLGAGGLTDAMLQRLQDANQDGSSLLDAASFNSVILSCLNAKQMETGWDIYRQMKLSGVKPDVYTYNILINGCARDKSVSTAFELVDTMRQEGLSPDVVTFNSLLKVVCHSGEMEIVLDLLKKMTASGVQPDSATFNTILTSASYHKRVDVTEHVLEDMRRRNVLPDQHTLLPVVSIYMHVGQTDDAVEALRVLSLRMLDGNKSSEGEFKFGKTKQIQDVLGDLARQNISLQEDTRELLMDAVWHTSPESLALYSASLAGLVHGDSDAWMREQSPWAARLSAQFDKQKTEKFAKSAMG